MIWAIIILGIAIFFWWVNATQPKREADEVVMLLAINTKIIINQFPLSHSIHRNKLLQQAIQAEVAVLSLQIFADVMFFDGTNKYKEKVFDQVVDIWSGVCTGFYNLTNTEQNRSMVKKNLTNRSLFDDKTTGITYCRVNRTSIINKDVFYSKFVKDVQKHIYNYTLNNQKKSHDEIIGLVFYENHNISNKQADFLWNASIQLVDQCIDFRKKYNYPLLK